MNTPEPQPAASDTSAESEPLRIGAGFDFSDPNGPLAFLYLRASQFLALGFLALVFFFFAVVVPLQTALWVDLKYGAWIVQHGAVPEHELFSPFADAGRPLWDLHWLPQVIFYLAYQAGAWLAGGDELRQVAGGVESLRTLHGLLIAAKVALVMLAIKRSTRSLPIGIAGAGLLVVLTIAGSQVERPQVFGEICFAALLWWVSGARLSRWTWLALPVLFVLWANCDESFVVGLLFLGLLWAGRMIELVARRRGNDIPLWKNSWTWQGLAALILSPAAVGLLNPQGLGIYAVVESMAQNPNLRTLPEWSPMEISVGLAPGIYLSTLVILALSQAASPRPLGVSRLMVLFVFALAPLYQTRLLTWWLLLVPWLAATLWCDTAAVLPRFWRRYRSVASFRKTVLAGLWLGGALFWCGLSQLLIGHDPLPLAMSTSQATPWPLAMQIKHGEGMPPAFLKALKDYPDRRFQGRMCVQHNLADFLVWSLPGEQADATAPADVLVYSNAAVFPEGYWRHYLGALLGKPGWKAILEHDRVNLIVIDPRQCSELAGRLRDDADWELVVDESDKTDGKKPWSGMNARLLVAVRRHPFLEGEGSRKP